MPIHLPCKCYAYTLAILWAGTWLNVLSRLALTPGGGSNTNTRPALSRFVGSFGLISIVKNNLNDGDGWRLEKTKKETNKLYANYLHLRRLISSFCWHISPHFFGCKNPSILFDEAKARFARIFSGRPRGQKYVLWFCRSGWLRTGWLRVDTYFSLWGSQFLWERYRQLIVSLKYCIVYGFYFLDGEKCVSKVATQSTVTPVDSNK